jgi:predicted metal-dependent hydrolase
MQAAIDELLRKKEALIQKQQASWNEYQQQIDGLEKAIRLLEGTPEGKRIDIESLYDDENPNYITGTEDGI